MIYEGDMSAGRVRDRRGNGNLHLTQRSNLSPICRIQQRRPSICKHAKRNNFRLIFSRCVFAFMIGWTFSSSTSFVSGWKFNFSRKGRQENLINDDESNQIITEDLVCTQANRSQEASTSVLFATNFLINEKVNIDDQNTIDSNSLDENVESQWSDDFCKVVEGPRLWWLLRCTLDRIKKLLLFKPPVGFVATFAITRLVLSGRIFQFHHHHKSSVTQNVEDALFLKKDQENIGMGEKRRGRAMVLDTDDYLYSIFGGVERARRRLCLAALTSFAPNDTTPKSATLYAIIDALQVELQPSDTWLRYIHKMVEPIARLEQASMNQSEADKNGRSVFEQAVRGDTIVSDNLPSNSATRDEWDSVISIAATTCQVRLVDAVLRMCRDRVLQTAYRLARTVEHLERRIQYTKTINLLFQHFFSKRIEGDRLCLSLAKAAYSLEVSRLGEICAILTERPSELPDTALIRALKATENRNFVHGSPHGWEYPSTQATEHVAGREQITQSVLNWVFHLFSRYSIRWKADGKGFLSVRRYNEADEFIDCPSAIATLHDEYGVDDGSKTWVPKAAIWVLEARRTLFNIVQQSLKSSTTDGLSSEYSVSDIERLEDYWCHNRIAPDTSVDQQWRTVVGYVNALSSWRRVGEGEKIRLRDVLGIKDLLMRMDFFGIPSTLFVIYVAGLAHERLVVPHWPMVRQEIIKAAIKVSEILKQRVWVPIKGIYDDIMNKSPTLMSALGLAAEETSLDHMLRDLNFGDGTPAARQEALRKATEQYELDLSNGMFANFARGRLIRLLLIQVQQLKVGMLSALDTIDVLLQGNRIHFKVLAAIPPFLMVTYGTRYFCRGFYNIRAQDLRPVGVVHGEMAQYLNKIEALIMLSDSRPGPDKTRRFKPSELGEITLHTHRYLTLLDFCCPPFPSGHCNQIHQSLQELTGSRGTFQRMEDGRQLQWVNRIRQDHQNLAKYL